MQLLRRALKEGSSLLNLEAQDLSSVFRAALDLIANRGQLDPNHREKVLSALDQRERLGSTAIGHSVAVPHAYLDCFAEQVIVPVRLKHAINLGAPDGIPIRFIFIPALHRDVGASANLYRPLLFSRTSGRPRCRGRIGRRRNTLDLS